MTVDTTENVDLENIIIDPATDGSITITADIKDANPPEMNYSRSKSATLNFKISKYVPDGIIIPANDHYDIEIDATTPKDDSTGYPATECDEIPAFFNNGTVSIVYNFFESTDDENKLDITSELFVEFKTPPAWYPYPLVNFTNTLGGLSIAQAMQGLVQSSNKSTRHEIIAEGTTIPLTFTINTWPGIMPIVVKNIVGRDANGVMLPMIKRGCLPPATFTIRFTNNLDHDIKLSQVTADFSFNYFEDDMLMDMTNVNKANNVKLYPSPKYLQSTDIKNLWAIADGYEKAWAGKRDEIVKVYAYYKRTDPVDNTKVDMKCLTMDPILDTGSYQYLPFVYKTRDSDAIGDLDHARQNSKGFEANEKAWVVTPADVCQGEKFKHLHVYTDADTNGIILPPNDKNCVFVVETSLRDDIEEEITEAEFLSCFKYVRFYDVVDKPFAKQVKIARTEIDKVFYESLSATFEDSVIFESTREDIPPFCRIKINDKTDWLPIYQNTSLQFSESLSQCNDGVRSRDIFYYSQSKSLQTVAPSPATPVTPVVDVVKVNKITLKPTKKRYEVGIVLSYGKFKGVHIHEYVEPKTGP